MDAFLAGGFDACAEASDGKEAVQVARRIKPDVIILDVSMPVMNGLEAASKLRKILPNTPLVLLSLHAAALSKGEPSKAGIRLVLSKDVALATLVDKARKLIRR